MGFLKKVFGGSSGTGIGSKLKGGTKELEKGFKKLTPTGQTWKGLDGDSIMSHIRDEYRGLDTQLKKLVPTGKTKNLSQLETNVKKFVPTGSNPLQEMYRRFVPTTLFNSTAKQVGAPTLDKVNPKTLLGTSPDPANVFGGMFTTDKEEPTPTKTIATQRPTPTEYKTKEPVTDEVLSDIQEIDTTPIDVPTIEEPKAGDMVQTDYMANAIADLQQMIASMNKTPKQVKTTGTTKGLGALQGNNKTLKEADLERRRGSVKSALMGTKRLQIPLTKGAVAPTTPAMNTGLNV